MNSYSVGFCKIFSEKLTLSSPFPYNKKYLDEGGLRIEYYGLSCGTPMHENVDVFFAWHYSVWLLIHKNSFKNSTNYVWRSVQ